MKIKSFLFASACALFAMAGCRSQEPVEVSIMSYNIRYDNPKDGEFAWENRKHATPVMLADMQPDVFGVQEARPQQMKFFVENLPEYGYYGVGRDDGREKGEFMTVFYRKDKFELLDSLTIWLSETPDVPSKGWDSHRPRTATITLLKHKESGKKFYYVNTHIDHLGPEAKKNGTQLILDKMAEINRKKLPVVMTGDFNMTPDYEVIVKLKESMKSAREFAEVTDSIPSYNNWQKASDEGLLDDNGNPVKVRHLFIDYIFYSPEGWDKCLSFQTIDKDYGVPFISDHYPIMARMVLK